MKQWWERQKTLSIPVPFSEEDELIRHEAQHKARVAQVRRRRTGIELTKDSLEVWVTVTDSNWIGGKLPRKDFRFTPSFEIVPTPKGSSQSPISKYSPTVARSSRLAPGASRPTSKSQQTGEDRAVPSICVTTTKTAPTKQRSIWYLTRLLEDAHVR